MSSYDLQRAITRGDIKAVRRCLNAGADIETSANRDGDTPLMVAVSSGISKYPQFPGNANKGSNQMAELLLDRGANVNFTKRSGRTALSIACDHANINMVKLIQILSLLIKSFNLFRMINLKIQNFDG